MYLNSDIGYATDIDCSRCRQSDAEPCGNGYWCETCAAGWKPPDCREPCDPGHHGINCLDIGAYDWQGRILAIHQVDSVLSMTFVCDAAIPDVYISHYFIHIERYAPDSLQALPYRLGNMTVVWSDFPDLRIEVRFTLVAVYNGQTISGKPSDIFVHFAQSCRDNTDVSELVKDTSTGDRESTDKTTALTFIALFCVAVLTCLILIVAVCKLKGIQPILRLRRLFSSSKHDDQLNEARCRNDAGATCGGLRHGAASASADAQPTVRLNAMELQQQTSDGAGVYMVPDEKDRVVLYANTQEEANLYDKLNI